MRKWILKDVKAQTHNRFLNLFELHYEVDGNPYTYFLASRKSEEELRCLHEGRETRPDGVILLLYKEDNGKKRLLLTSEFRPAYNRVFTSVPAGLLEEGEDVLAAARREAKEEVGVEIGDATLLIPSSSNSEGLSDEMCAAVLARITKMGENALDGYEDISYGLYEEEEVRKMLDDPSRIFPLPGRILLELVLLKWKSE